MPFNPGVYDQSGQILGQGILSGAGSLSRVLEQLAAHQEQRDDEDKFMTGNKKLWRPKDDAAAQDMGYRSVADYDASDAREVMGNIHARVAKQAVQQHELQQKLTAQQLAVLAGEQQSRGKFQGLATQAYKGADAVATGNQMMALAGMGPGADATSRTLPPDMMQRLGIMAGLPARDVLEYSQSGMDLAKAAKEGTLNGEPAAKTFGQTQVIFSPKTGQFQVAPDRSGIGTQMVDENGNPIPNMYLGPKGPIVLRPPSTAGMSHDYNSEMNKLRVELGNRNAALGATDEEIKAMDMDPKLYRAQQQRKLDMFKQAAKQTIDSYHAQGLFPAETRDQFYSDMGLPGAAPAAGGAGPATADQIRALFQAGKISREEARKRISALGGMK